MNVDFHMEFLVYRIESFRLYWFIVVDRAKNRNLNDFFIRVGHFMVNIKISD